ncbi:hypothetical protein NBRC116583_28130 [Arenicella sp. 4NH20-0111]
MPMIALPTAMIKSPALSVVMIIIKVKAMLDKVTNGFLSLVATAGTNFAQSIPSSSGRAKIAIV